MSAFFVKIDGKESGPVARADLMRMLKSGTLRSDTPIRAEHSSMWLSAGNQFPEMLAGKESTSRLTTCPDCGHAVSKSSRACPRCGGVVNPHASGLRWLVIIGVAFFIGSLLFGCPMR